MKIVRAQAPDGRIFRAVDGNFHITGKSASDSAYRQMIAFGSGYGGRDQLQRPYEKSVWVMRAIKYISQPIAALPLELYGDRRKGDQLLSTGPAVDFWEDPFVGLSRVDGIEATIAWLNLHGNAFWIYDDTWFSPTAAKSKLIIARPDRMSPIREGGEHIGWRYRDAANRAITLPLIYVEHLKSWNPYDDVWGLASWEAARVATEADYFAGNYLRNLMAASGDQGDIVVAKGGTLGDSQKEQIKQALIERRRFRQRGEFIPVFLTGDVAVEDSKVQAPDATFVSNRLENRHEIFIAFGVPPSMADVKASYSTGADSDYARLIEQTCMPMSSKVCEHVESVSRRLNDGSSPRICACFAWEENSCIQAIRQARVENATKFWDRGLSWQTINQVMDLGLVPFVGWEKAYIPFSVAEVGSDSPLTSPDYADSPLDPAEQLSRLFKSRAKTCPVPTCEKATTPETALWQKHMGQRRTVAGVYKSKFNKQLQKARAEVLAKLDKAGRAEMLKGLTGGKLRAVASDFSFDLVQWKKGLLIEMRKAGIYAMDEAGKQLFEEISKDDVWTMPPAKAQQFLTLRDNRLSDVADNVFAQIQHALGEGIDAGESMSELADRVRAEFNDISKGRATTIAQTETSAAYGTARQEAMEQAGVSFKQWLTSGNENVRDTHMAAQGQTVALDQPFIVGGASLMFPGDPEGPPQEVINCHCVQVAAAALPKDPKA